MLDSDSKILIGALLIVVSIFGVFSRIGLVFAAVFVVGVVLIGLGLLGRGRDDE